MDIFAESSRAYEKDNPNDKVIILDKSVIDRFEKYKKDEGNDIELSKFIEINLNCIGY